MEAFILDKIRNGAALPGTYPPNEETRAEFARSATRDDPSSTKGSAGEA